MKRLCLLILTVILTGGIARAQDKATLGVGPAAPAGPVVVSMAANHEADVDQAIMKVRNALAQAKDLNRKFDKLQGRVEKLEEGQKETLVSLTKLADAQEARKKEVAAVQQRLAEANQALAAAQQEAQRSQMLAAQAQQYAQQAQAQAQSALAAAQRANNRAGPKGPGRLLNALAGLVSGGRWAHKQ